MLQKISLATDRPGGLEPEQVDDLRWALSLLTLHVNTLIEFSIKTTLARVYLGRDPGDRVSRGMIAAGNVIALEGALWFSDMRDFTETSGRLSPQDLIALLNEYFATVVASIYGEGGEVLKYIGDAILAVFPVSNYADGDEACRAALAAVSGVDRRLAELNARRETLGRRPLAHGIGLHYGEALYGNIGGVERLDFTLIGRQVNVASRIEGMTKQLDCSPICSAAFAQRAGLELETLGCFDLRGVTEPVELFRISAC
jgi:adenylate cyclase